MQLTVVRPGNRFGWKGDALQRAMDDRCLGDVCKSLETQSTEDAVRCVKARTVEEDIDGCKFFACLNLSLQEENL